MAVSQAGGFCECRECGATCPGRFRACADVVARPGYVPVTAPKLRSEPDAAVALRPTPLRMPEVVPRPEITGRVEPKTAASTEVAEVRSLLEELISRPDRAVSAIEALNHAMAARDEELLATFERLTEAYRALTEEVRGDHEARRELAAAVDRLAERMNALETARGMLLWRRPAGE